VHIVFLELIIDPACSVVFEAESEEPDIMRRPPRILGAPLFGRKMIFFSLLQGVSVLLVVLAVYGISLYRGQGELEARALSFTTLIFANIGLILANRSWSRDICETLRLPNAALWWVVGGAVLFLGAVLYLPFLKDLFRFSTLHVDDLFICLAAAVPSIVWFEGFKRFRYARRGAGL
jgi:P-type Ca2+ transporter type 2C